MPKVAPARILLAAASWKGYVSGEELAPSGCACTLTKTIAVVRRMESARRQPLLTPLSPATLPAGGFPASPASNLALCWVVRLGSGLLCTSCAGVIDAKYDLPLGPCTAHPAPLPTCAQPAPLVPRWSTTRWAWVFCLQPFPGLMSWPGWAVALVQAHTFV